MEKDCFLDIAFIALIPPIDRMVLLVYGGERQNPLRMKQEAFIPKHLFRKRHTTTLDQQRIARKRDIIWD